MSNAGSADSVGEEDEGGSGFPARAGGHRADLDVVVLTSP